MNTKNIFRGAAICVCLFSFLQGKAYDHIIFRNCDEYDVKLNQIADDKIIYQDASDPSGEKKEALTKNVYMVFVENQGNFYFNEQGKRVSGEQERANPKKNDVIYMKSGAEIPVDYVRLTESWVEFKPKKKWKGLKGMFGKGGNADYTTVSRDDVFIIRYKSGMIDVITPFEPTVEETAVVEEEAPVEYSVLFHEVKRGETLQKIADTYGVSVEQIAEWNEIKNARGSMSLSPGSQLMIYQPRK